MEDLVDDQARGEPRLVTVQPGETGTDEYARDVHHGDEHDLPRMAAGLADAVHDRQAPNVLGRIQGPRLELLLDRSAVGIVEVREDPPAVGILDPPGRAFSVGVGSRRYSFRPWKPAIDGVPEALSRLADEPVVLVQSGLVPHAGYDRRFRLLTPETLRDPRSAGAAVLLARRIDAYPFRMADLGALLEHEPIVALPDGLVAVRLPGVDSGPRRPSESPANTP
jgi:hypothetical protein